MQKAFSLIEIIMAVSIILMLSAAGFYFFNRANLADVVNQDKSSIITILEQARSLTISSKNAEVYGVNFSADKVVMFKGATFNSSDPNNFIYNLNSNVVISNISIDDASSNIIFSRLTGEASSQGSITLTRTDGSQTGVIQISKTGVIK